MHNLIQFFILIQFGLKMYLRSLLCWNHRFSQVIRPTKTLKQSKSNIREIAKYFSISTQQNDTDQIITKKYLDYWAKKSNYSAQFKQNNLVDLLLSQRRLKFVELTKQQIAKNYQFYNKQADAVINNFIMFLLEQMNRFRLGKLTHEETKIWQNQILQIVNSINHYAYFMKKNKSFCMKYLNLMSFIHGKAKIYNHHDFNLHLKQVLDALLILPNQQFNPSEIIFLFAFVSNFSVHVWYYQKADIILTKLWSSLPPKWQKNPHLRQKILRSIQMLGIQSQKIYEKVWAIFYESNIDDSITVTALITLIRMFQITPQNCQQTKIKQKIHKLAKSKNQDTFFQRTAHQLYRAQIWLPEFWIPFFKFGMINFESFSLYNMFSIFQLLKIEKQNIPDEVYKIGIKFEQKVKKQYKEITILDIQKEYERQYSTYFRKLNCQSQLANSFRLLNKGQVRTQVSLGIFNVDILLNNKYVVEVNGGSHYLQNIETGQKRLGLKSRFRQRILPKMGYHVFNVNVFDFNEGSFEIIAEIYNQIQKQQASIN